MSKSEDKLKKLENFLKKCQTNGVFIREIEFEGIKLSIDVPAKLSMTPVLPAKGSEKKATAIEAKADLQQQYDFSRDAVETLHVEDPSAYEAALFRGELGEEKNH
jgi:hypothetical protein